MPLSTDGEKGICFRFLFSQLALHFLALHSDIGPQAVLETFRSVSHRLKKEPLSSARRLAEKVAQRFGPPQATHTLPATNTAPTTLLANWANPPAPVVNRPKWACLDQCHLVKLIRFSIVASYVEDTTLSTAPNVTDQEFLNQTHHAPQSRTMVLHTLGYS